MKNLLIIAIIITCFTGFTSIKKSFVLPEEKIMDIAYGHFPSSRMDVYLPANRNAQTPFVILIHGGGWVMGDKSQDHPTQDSLLAHGIACANVNYRFADSLHTHYRELLADIDSAVHYCISHAGKWGTRKDRFIVSGGSAGGHLSLLYGYTSSVAISAIIAECPPTDLTDTVMLNYAQKAGLMPLIKVITGGELLSSSPVDHIKDIPTLLVHGTADKTVLYSQSVELDHLLKSRHITHKLITIPGADHDCNMNDPATRAMVYKEIVGWVERYGR
jgi:acetyl esterase/lipase